MAKRAAGYNIRVSTIRPVAPDCVWGGQLVQEIRNFRSFLSTRPCILYCIMSLYCVEIADRNEVAVLGPYIWQGVSRFFPCGCL
jgi:hypothetical protein